MSLESILIDRFQSACIEVGELYQLKCHLTEELEALKQPSKAPKPTESTWTWACQKALDGHIVTRDLTLDEARSNPQEFVMHMNDLGNFVNSSNENFAVTRSDITSTTWRIKE
jgi:hypothetical protein